MKRIFLFFLVAGLLVGCSDNEQEEGTNIDKPLEFSLEESGSGFVYTVYNRGEEEILLSFTSGQRYEYELSQDGEVIYRYSDDHLFTQALEDITVEPGEELTFEIELPDIDPGEYEIKVFLVAADLTADSEVEQTFTVE